MEMSLRGKDLGELERLLRLFEAGELSGALTVARLLLVSRDVASIERWLEGRVATDARDALLHLIEQHRHGCQCVAALREVRTGGARGERTLAAAPGGSVGDAEALARAERVERATRELVERFEAWGLLGTRRRTLELGCGAGRLQAALSSRVALAAGVDASPEMVARARWCCSRLSNTRHEVGHGSDLTAFGDATFQLVFAVDAFPGVGPERRAGTERGRAPNPFAEAARVLAPGGALVFQLRSPPAGSPDAGQDVRQGTGQDVMRLAESQGLELVATGERAFECWDGLTYRLRRLG